MELEFLKRFEGRIVRLILNNNFVYNSVTFKITSEKLIEFKDRSGEIIAIEPSFISMITELGGVDK